MADELTKGLNVLLHPKFTEYSQRLDRLEVYHKDLSTVVAQKEERQEVDRLRDHVDAQIKQLDSVIGMVKDKMLGLDELRNREIRALAKSLEQKATLANFNQIADQLQATNVALGSKVEVSKADQLARQIHALSEEVSQKSTAARCDQLGKQLQVFSDSLAKKVDTETTDHIQDRLKALQGELALRAETCKLEELFKKLEALTEETGHKADDARVDQMNRQMRLLGEDLAQRADVRKVEHLTRQIQGLGEEVSQKAENAATDQILRQVHALGDAVSMKVEHQKHGLLSDQVLKMREDMFTMKADLSKLEDHGRQLEQLHGAVAVDSARVKHLCLMYAGGDERARDSLKDVTSPATPSTMAPSPGPTAPLVPPAVAQRQRQLPSMTSTPKPSSTTLPSMAASPAPASPYPRS